MLIHSLWIFYVVANRFLLLFCILLITRINVPIHISITLRIIRWWIISPKYIFVSIIFRLCKNIWYLKYLGNYYFRGLNLFIFIELMTWITSYICTNIFNFIHIGYWIWTKVIFFKNWILRLWYVLWHDLWIFNIIFFQEVLVWI